MSESQLTPQKPSAWVRFWRFLVRLIFVLAMGILLGAFLYWAAPTLYRQYIQPVQIHGMQIEALATRLDILEKNSKDQLSSFLTRIQTLESLQDKDKEEIAELMSQVERIEAKSATQQAQLENLESLTAQIEALQNQLVELQKDQALNESTTQEIQIQINKLEEKNVEQAAEIEAVSTTVNLKDARWDRIENDLQILLSMELLNRARYNLSQGKLVQAQADIQSAHNFIASIQNQTVEGQSTRLLPIQDYLESAITDLPGNPVSSADNLEGAWELMLQVLPVMDFQESALEVTPEASPIIAPTATPTPSS
jgi:DNA repair exonuclease SbcCD ATPase subunit